MIRVFFNLLHGPLLDSILHCYLPFLQTISTSVRRSYFIRFLNAILMHSCASSSVLYNAKTTSDVKIVDDVDISVDISVDNAADNAFEKRSVLSYLSFSCSSCCRCYLEILLWKHRYTLILIRVPRHRN